MEAYGIAKNDLQGSLESLYKEARKLHALKELDSARKCYRKIYNKQKTLTPELSLALGVLSVQEGKLSSALFYARECVRLSPQSEKSWILLSLLHRELGDVELAWANLAKAFDLKPQSSLALELGQSWALEDDLFEGCRKYLKNAEQKQRKIIKSDGE